MLELINDGRTVGKINFDLDFLNPGYNSVIAGILKNGVLNEGSELIIEWDVEKMEHSFGGGLKSQHIEPLSAVH